VLDPPPRGASLLITARDSSLTRARAPDTCPRQFQDREAQVTALTLTLIGRDRPGLVRSLSERVAAAGGNWLESRMARLAGQFAGILLVDVPEAGVARLVADLQALEAEGLHAAVERGLGEDAPAPYQTLVLELVGQDHPGIVREIAQALASRRVNIEELTTRVVSASFSGERMFEAEARLRVPADLSAVDLRDTLEVLANELMVDIRLDPATA
jgi:glycine cleavage system regulatory protein